jgi:inhibitor of KinA sporulation pathway (predicted exonuclease)
MKLVSLDLEFNQLDNQPRIIEIGLTIGDLQTRTILDSKSILVNPEQGITEYIATLTGITDYMLKDAPMLPDAYRQMMTYLKEHNVHRQPIVWGNGDASVLKSSLNQLGHYPDDFPFGYTEMDVKTIVQAILTSRGQPTQGGLAKSMTKFGLRFMGRKHRAIDDSRNTMAMYFKMLELLRKAN